jgi:hypothetical protein
MIKGDKTTMNPNKIVLVAFQGEPMCVVHVWLNALDMHKKGHDVKVVVEGSATKLIKVYHDTPNEPFANLYRECKEKRLIDAVCKACATKMESIDAVIAENLPVVGDMNGHPALIKYLENGYTIITF